VRPGRNQPTSTQPKKQTTGAADEQPSCAASAAGRYGQQTPRKTSPPHISPLLGAEPRPGPLELPIKALLLQDPGELLTQRRRVGAPCPCIGSPSGYPLRGAEPLASTVCPTAVMAMAGSCLLTQQCIKAWIVGAVLLKAPVVVLNAFVGAELQPWEAGQRDRALRQGPRPHQLIHHHGLPNGARGRCWALQIGTGACSKRIHIHRGRYAPGA